MNNTEFWAAIKAQITELQSATSADDVLRILAKERNPNPDTLVDGQGFFAGGGGDDSVLEALTDAGWRAIWVDADYYFAMRAPDGSAITYVEGDIYRGDQKEGK